MTSYCSWDLTVLVISVITTIVLLGAAVWCFVKYKAYSHSKQLSTKIMCLSSSLLCIVLLFGTLSFLPIKVSINDSEITVTKIIGTVSIKIADIQQIERTKAVDTVNSVRIFASGGFWGYIGKLNSPALGDYFSYVTNSADKITIKTNDKIYIISCNNPEAMINAVMR
ncbi:MAG: PH domain-containing protein [Paludibacter sp.]|jgi:hypothetical protein|nr:PH domain-containing protein [Paludibacter sp.]